MKTSNYLRLSILIIALGVIMPISAQVRINSHLSSAKNLLDDFRRQASNGIGDATYQTAYNATKEYIAAINKLRSTDPEFVECKQALMELYPKLSDGAYFYASKANQEEVLKFACAYVDVSILPCMSNESLKNSHTYGTLANLAATNLYNRRKYDRSISYFQAYLESSDDSARENAFEGLARCYFEQQKFAMAASIANQGSKFFPNNLNILLVGIESAGYNGNDPEMEQMLALALRLKPEHCGLLEYQGKLYERTKRYEDAANSFNRIVQIQGPTIDHLTHLGFDLYNAATLSYIRARQSGNSTELAKARQLYSAAAPHLQTVLTNIPTAANVARALAFCHSVNNDGTRLQEANRTLQSMNVATVELNALPTLVQNYAPSFIIEQNAVATAQIAAGEKESIISDIDIDIPATGIKNDRLLVLIIANENYDYGIAPVEFARRDGESFRNYSEKVLGADPDHIFCVFDASKSRMEYELKRIKDLVNIDHNFNVIFYYAGHGMPDLLDNKSSYLVPTDMPARNNDEMISLTKIYDDFDDMNAKSVTVFLDACFSGNGRNGNALYSARYVAYDAAEQEAKGNTVIFSAGNGQQVANPYKEKGHGFFTYHLLKALKESQGAIRLADLGNTVSRNVAIDVKSKLHGDQTPTVTASEALGTSWHTRKLTDR